MFVQSVCVRFFSNQFGTENGIPVTGSPVKSSATLEEL